MGWKALSLKSLLEFVSELHIRDLKLSSRLSCAKASTVGPNHSKNGMKIVPNYGAIAQSPNSNRRVPFNELTAAIMGRTM